MDLFILLLVCGCAALGLFWGAVRIASYVVAAVAAFAAGRWAGPAAAELIAGGTAPSVGTQVLATGGVALLAAALVVLAALGLRRALHALHLSWLDRLVGLLIGGGGAALVLALLLALAAARGHPPTTLWASRLASTGQAMLSLHTLPKSSNSPSSTPSTPTNSGQHPN
ncbi:MAG: CvpA family protein [Thermoanaerobaculales bacterium]